MTKKYERDATMALYLSHADNWMAQCNKLTTQSSEELHALINNDRKTVLETMLVPEAKKVLAERKKLAPYTAEDNTLNLEALRETLGYKHQIENFSNPVYSEEKLKSHITKHENIRTFASVVITLAARDALEALQQRDLNLEQNQNPNNAIGI